MKFVVDTHTHSIASGHAFSTIEEMAKQAKINKIEMFALTDHGPAMPGSQTRIYFELLPQIPHDFLGIKLLKGIEANIMNHSGKLDLEEKYLKKLDIVIASFHDICIKPSTEENNTLAMIKAIQNPVVDIVGHLGNSMYKVDYERIVRAARDNNKLVEINNHSFHARKGSKENCRNIAILCKNYGVRVTCGSDAHISTTIGELNVVSKMLDEIGMPEDLILNTSIDKMYIYLNEKKKRLLT